MDRPLSFSLRPPRPTWRLTVVGAHDVTPHMRRVSFVGALGGFSHRPGQDLVLSLPGAYGATVRRHYTIRRFDRDEARLDIDFVLHGASPATDWARGAQLGDEIDAEGPRGRTGAHGPADWRLFTGDETALPGIAAMLESLPAGERAFAFVEVAGPDDEQPIETAADLTLVWLHRHAPPRPASPLLIGALAAFELPPGAGQAVVIGETATVRAQRQGLIARGLAKTQIAAEGYWRPDRVGGHDHIREPEMIFAEMGLGRRRGR
jgi:NADPH-dependent ferric siderophore reductase